LNGGDALRQAPATNALGNLRSSHAEPVAYRSYELPEIFIFYIMHLLLAPFSKK